MKVTRIYAVGHANTVRLVRATSRSQAMAHVAASLITVSIPSKDELVDLVVKGTPVEQVRQQDGELFGDENESTGGQDNV